MSSGSQSSSSSSQYPILCASFNQDSSGFAISTRDGFKIFDSNTGRLCYERASGAFVVVEMLYSSSLLAIVGGGEQPSLSPRRLCLFNTTTGAALRELNFLTSVLAVRLNKKRLVVVLQEKTYIYDPHTLAILDAIDTVPNVKGLCAFSPSLDGCFLAVPSSTTKGSVLVYNVMELQSHCEIDAHRSPLAAIVMSCNGMYIATASEQGTIIRVHLVSEATKSYSFRRGTYPSTIFSLSFGPSTQLPDVLVALSSSGSIHVFSLGLAINQRGRRSSSFLGSLLPDSVNDAFDPAYHRVLHNAVPAGVKSNVVVRKVDKIADTSLSESVASRATLSVITFNGHFLEYTVYVNTQNESKWSLESEFNLLAVISGEEQHFQLV
ncbi:PREDICTED: autophagy-related protein 18b [Populus euphratica]|uniref:Autophagy-related protein 18b n=1 Tax=Populus euphratica TaxID=75702 RepID=A0AAJ6TW81_POPEU|nr:PREDICTED: autophagy-related protein 18b [Populus euphratica]